MLKKSVWTPLNSLVLVLATATAWEDKIGIERIDISSFDIFKIFKITKFCCCFS